MGSVQFQIVPHSRLYFFLKTLGPFQCLVNANYRVLICCTCHFQSSSLFVYFGFLFCKSLQCLISALTQGGKGGHLFRLTCSVVWWGGRTMQTNITDVCGECSQSIDHIGFSPVTTCAFLVYTSQAPGCSAGELSKVGSGFRALPRSKLLRFRFLVTPQRHRLSWACVLCPSQV